MRLTLGVAMVAAAATEFWPRGELLLKPGAGGTDQVRPPMLEIEITEIPPLAPVEKSLLDFHSVANVVNVVHCELVVLGLGVAANERHFSQGIDWCARVMKSLSSRAPGLESLRELGAMERAIFDEIEAKTASSPGPGGHVAETVANLRAVFGILTVRAGELLGRAETEDRWVDFDVDALRRNFTDVFAAIERNSRGRYRILYNAALQQTGDYYVDFKIESHVGRTLSMPPALQDVMRDLIANARKYTAPGGHITAALHSNADELRFVVRDDGRGIPPDEIREVVAFGKRASNVGAVRTMGGGFGLTKAFLVTKRFGGRFWIASEPDRGTRIRLWIPRAT